MLIEWWYWIVGGCLLIGFVLLIPSFTLIWFGLGALAAGLLGYWYPSLPFAGQVALWLLVSISCMIMWHRYLKRKP